ncbi:MAG: hypothetical protein HQK50_04330 [Oligoflexia bacterium]|nr:hypothetical protein [Oligoflexia bacterium]MBF0364772.1 hypothetical protein [Oligoflexia bacterium]
MTKKIVLTSIVVLLIASVSAAIAIASSTGEKSLCPDGRPVCEDCINRGGDGCGGTNLENRSEGKDIGSTPADTSSTDTSTKQI